MKINPACIIKNGAGCANLGENYQSGHGITKNIKKANELYKKGCDLGNGKGCTQLGYNYEFGNGVKENMKKALELYKKGCDLGCKKVNNLPIDCDKAKSMLETI